MFGSNGRKLTDDDFEAVAGRKDQLSGKLQERYGMAKDDADREIEAWLARQDKS